MPQELENVNFVIKTEPVDPFDVVKFDEVSHDVIKIEIEPDEPNKPTTRDIQVEEVDSSKRNEPATANVAENPVQDDAQLQQPETGDAPVSVQDESGARAAIEAVNLVADSPAQSKETVNVDSEAQPDVINVDDAIIVEAIDISEPSVQIDLTQDITIQESDTTDVQITKGGPKKTVHRTGKSAKPTVRRSGNSTERPVRRTNNSTVPPVRRTGKSIEPPNKKKKLSGAQKRRLIKEKYSALADWQREMSPPRHKSGRHKFAVAYNSKSRGAASFRKLANPPSGSRWGREVGGFKQPTSPPQMSRRERSPVHFTELPNIWQASTSQNTPMPSYFAFGNSPSMRNVVQMTHLSNQVANMLAANNGRMFDGSSNFGPTPYSFNMGAQTSQYGQIFTSQNQITANFPTSTSGLVSYPSSYYQPSGANSSTAYREDGRRLPEKHPYRRYSGNNFTRQTSPSSSRQSRMSAVEEEESNRYAYDGPSQSTAPQAGHSKSMPKGLKAVILNHSNVKGRMTITQSGLLSDKLMECLNREAASSRGPIPRFHSSGLHFKMFQITCADKATLDWLKQTVANLPELWPDGELHVRTESEDNATFIDVSVYIIGPKEKPWDVLKRLGRQNPGLQTDKWRVYQQFSKDNNKGQVLCLGVDQSSFQALRAMDFRPFLGLTRIRFVLTGLKNKYKN